MSFPNSSQPESNRVPHRETVLTRREWLSRGGAGFGALALASLLDREPLSSRALANDASATLDGQPWRSFEPRAKSVIFLFMEGGPSHIDTFDPKPLLNKLDGKPLPPTFKPVVVPMGEFHSPVLAPKRTWAQHGQSGLWVSDWLPHTAECVDDIAVIRSCWSNGLNHVGGVCQMNTGNTLAGRPSLGAWVSYGLGSENQDLPSYVVLQDNEGAQVAGGPRNWGAGFMPAGFQGAASRAGRNRSRTSRPRRPSDWNGSVARSIS